MSSLRFYGAYVSWRLIGIVRECAGPVEPGPMVGSAARSCPWPRSTISTPTRFSTNRRPTRTSISLRATRRCRTRSAANGAGAENAALSAFGRQLGHGRDVRCWRATPTRTPPKLKTFDAKGFRRDVVEFHPAYHGFMAREHRSRAACLDLAPMTRKPAPATGGGGARRALLHGGAGRERPPLPDHHDARRVGGACGRAGAACRG